ncbi:hypothetical protein Bbelb_315790 [Branchiostoma belcheri]|nr:hypothetical protein Bbelb_315790 [Branchiostoma belcheri]
MEAATQISVPVQAQVPAKLCSSTYTVTTNSSHSSNDHVYKLQPQALRALGLHFEVNQVLDRQFTQLTQALETAETSRVKRTVDFTLSPMFPHETEDQAEEVHLSGVSMTDVYTMAFLQLDDVAFLFLASGNSQVHNVTIFALDDDSEDFSKAGEWQVSGPVVLEAISMGSSGFLLVSEEDEKNVPKAYRTEIYTFNRGATSFVQVYDIPVQKACDIEPFTIQKQSYLVVANCPTDSAEGTDNNSSLIYK